MDKLESSNNNKRNAVVASFEYTSYPASSSNTPTGDSEDGESNKSTPYFTPLEFLQTSFEFPSPTTSESPMHQNIQLDTNNILLTNSTSNDTLQNAQIDIVDLELYTVAPESAQDDTEIERRGAYTTKSFSVAAPKQLLQRSPSFGRKYKRFSLYDRRSCSPQHLVTRNSTVEERVAPEKMQVIDNKENTVPLHKTSSEKADEGNAYVSHSGHNSPRILKEESVQDNNRINFSPKILKDDSALDANRSNYSPNLLTSINNLNLSGSPLGIINSAGYKNGNFFRFPEIDHVVQDFTFIDTSMPNYESSRIQCYENLNRSRRLRSKSSEKAELAKQPPNAESSKCRAESTAEQENANLRNKNNFLKNRKNKNNLTIRISDEPIKTSSQATPLTKPKTPTIKEKARSLDSAANECELSVAAQSRRESHASCDEIDAQIPNVVNICGRNTTEMCLHSDVIRHTGNIYSTSLSQLDTHSTYVTTTMSSNRMSRRKSPGVNSADWLIYHRKHNPYHVPQNHKYESHTAQSSLDSDSADYRGDSPQRSGFEVRSAANTENAKYGATSTYHLSSGATLAPRTLHKHNPMLHSSNNNLKTLPEFLTLVEFSTSNSPSPFKQKSMELPISAQSHLPSIQQVKNTASSTMNLLQRRGSNHSLTLNLHSSCGNLMNSGLSVSNYSLGSVGNVNTLLNSKSSYNLDTTAQVPPQKTSMNMSSNIAQVSRQNLFRRQGSNHSIMLTGPTTNSCGELNTVSNQQGLNGEKFRLISGGNSMSLTTSTASTSNVTSNAATPKRGLLERRGSNQSLTLNMTGILGHSTQLLADGNVKNPEQKPKLQVCSCTAAQSAHQRKFYSTENLNSNRGSQQYYDINSKQLCFGSASDLKPSVFTVEPNTLTAGPSDENSVCTCTGARVRNIMTRPLSPQTTSEEFKTYLAGIQMLQNASNMLNQYDLIKLNYVFDNSYKSSKRIVEQPPILSNSRDSAETPTSSHQLVTSEDCELLALYQAVVQHIVQPPIPQLDEEEQKLIFRDLHKEFWDLPLNHQEKPMVFGSQTKNRYKTILPNEHSRVILESETKELQKLNEIVVAEMPEDAVTGGDAKQYMVVAEDAPYINANYIKGPDYVSKCYVATQGPMPNTIFEFWLMIYQNTQRYIRRSIDGGSSNSPHVDKELLLQQYYQKIIMLTNFTENSQQKCAVYFPVDVNEIFAVGAKQEVFQLSAPLREFFAPYLNVSSASHGFGFNDLDKTIGIESIKVTLTDENRRTLAAANNNFFLIRNVGIVRRNGYSIRKFVVLYCISVPNGQADKAPMVYHLQKLYCYHYWYPDWPDHHSPRDINTLLDTCLHVLNLGKCESEFDNYDELACERNAHLHAQRIELYKQDIFNAVQPLPVIHCSAGIGRTGCFTAILNAVRQLRQSLAFSLTAMARTTLKTTNDSHEKKRILDSSYETDSSFEQNTLQQIAHILSEIQSTLTKSEKETDIDAPSGRVVVTFGKLPKMPDIYVDILGIVCNLRLQRGGMVQNSEQYELIHRAICLYLKRTLALRHF